MSETEGQETPKPEAAAPQPAQGIDCERARASLTLHVRGVLEGEAQTQFRAHILVCEECRDSYRVAISTSAQIGRGMSDARFDRAKRERRMHVRALPFKVGNFGRNRKAYWMRAMIFTALMILLVTRVPGAMRPPTLMATWENGNVYAGTREISGGAPQAKLVTGDWVTTQQTGAVNVTGHGGRAELGPGSALLIENPRGFRVRFQRGAIEFSGKGLVSTQYGFLELDGGSVRLVDTTHGLEIHTLKGSPEWTHPLGTDELESGTMGLAQSPGPLVAGAERDRLPTPKR